MLYTGGVEISTLTTTVGASDVSSVFAEIASQAGTGTCAGETAVVTTFAEGSPIVIVPTIAGAGT